MCDSRVMRIKEVMSRTSLSRATIYRGMAVGTFPHSIQLSPNRVGWVESKVEEWIKSKPSSGAANSFNRELLNKVFK